MILRPSLDHPEWMTRLRTPDCLVSSRAALRWRGWRGRWRRRLPVVASGFTATCCALMSGYSALERWPALRRRARAAYVCYETAASATASPKSSAFSRDSECLLSFVPPARELRSPVLPEQYERRLTILCNARTHGGVTPARCAAALNPGWKRASCAPLGPGARLSRRR
jgi:hypothetical protein